MAVVTIAMQTQTSASRSTDPSALESRAIWSSARDRLQSYEVLMSEIFVEGFTLHMRSAPVTAIILMNDLPIICVALG